jgi:hypothetical protein
MELGGGLRLDEFRFAGRARRRAAHPDEPAIREQCGTIFDCRTLG